MYINILASTDITTAGVISGLLSAQTSGNDSTNVNTSRAQPTFFGFLTFWPKFVAPLSVVSHEPLIELHRLKIPGARL